MTLSISPEVAASAFICLNISGLVLSERNSTRYKSASETCKYNVGCIQNQLVEQMICHRLSFECENCVSACHSLKLKFSAINVHLKVSHNADWRTNRLYLDSRASDNLTLSPTNHCFPPESILLIRATSFGNADSS